MPIFKRNITISSIGVFGILKNVSEDFGARVQFFRWYGLFSLSR
jgi:hypothetical protein